MTLYLRWLALPVALFGAGLLLPSRPGAGTEQTMHPQLRVLDKKVRRTVRLHEAAADPGEPPLFRENRPGLPLELSVDPVTWRLLLVKSNRKMFAARQTNAAVRFAGRQPIPATIGTRGAGTLKADLPSLRVKLFRTVRIAPKIELKRFYLMSLAEDAHNIETLFGYRLLEPLGLFLCHYQLVALSVNGEAQGAYLLIEPPRNAIRRAQPQTIAIHRRRKVNVYKTYWTAAAPDVHSTLSALRALCYLPRIDDPVRRLEELLDLEAYLEWTATNALIYNRDSLDEPWFYEVRADRGRPSRLRLMGWDYDDILVDLPKPGIEDPLLYSCQDLLDQQIQRHPALYARYRGALRRLLQETLPPGRLIAVLRAVVALRDGIDDGRPAEIQRVARLARREAAALYERRLLRRHAELLRLCR